MFSLINLLLNQILIFSERLYDKPFRAPTRKNKIYFILWMPFAERTGFEPAQLRSRLRIISAIPYHSVTSDNFSKVMYENLAEMIYTKGNLINLICQVLINNEMIKS